MQRLNYAIALVLLIGVASALAFMGVEHLNFLDLVYLTLATMATVGYGDVHPVTDVGKIVAMLVILFGVGAAYYTFYNGFVP